MAVMLPCKATAGGPRPADPGTLGKEGVLGRQLAHWGRELESPGSGPTCPGRPNPLSQLGTQLLCRLVVEPITSVPVWSSNLGGGASESPGGLVKAQIVESHPRSFGSVGVGRGPVVYISQVMLVLLVQECTLRTT